MHRRAFLASLPALALPLRASAECAARAHAAYFVTQAGSLVPPDGGVLVALKSVALNEGSSDPFGGEWTLVQGTRRTRLRMSEVGPGLRRLDLPQNATGALRIESPTGALELTRGPALPALEAPAIRGVYLSGGIPSVTLVRQVPAAAVVAVLRRHGGRTPQPALRGRARAGTLSVVLAEEGRCEPPLPGALMPSIGASVDLVYVDVFGRSSPASRVVRFDG